MGDQKKIFLSHLPMACGCLSGKIYLSSGSITEKSNCDFSTGIAITPIMFIIPNSSHFFHLTPQDVVVIICS